MADNTKRELPNSPWNSLERTKLTLEIIKIVFSIFVPLAILYVGDGLKEAEANRENEARVIALRFDTYQKLSNHLNNIYTYFTFKGQWKDFTPSEIIFEKRSADKIQAINHHLFSDRFNEKYRDFIKSCFAEGRGGWGKDALLRTSYQNRKAVKPTTRLPKTDSGAFSTFTWQDEWNSLFTTDEKYTFLGPDNQLNDYGREVEVKYNDLNSIIAEELKLSINEP